MPYALQRPGDACPVLRPARALLARIPLGLRFASTAPQPVARRCSSASSLLWRRLTSRLRASSASASHLSRHTVQVSASRFESEPGDRPGRHQRWTRTRIVSRVGVVAAHHEIGVALPEAPIEDRLAGRAPARPGTLENPQFTSILMIMCYSKRLKYKKENVRPQFLSVRQDAQSGHSLRSPMRSLKPRNAAVFRGWLCTLDWRWRLGITL
jgi:hypothetical protein